MKTIKPWGYELLWAQSSANDGYAAKILHINPNSKLSLQYHKYKEETIMIKSGILIFETYGKIIVHIDNSISYEFVDKKISKHLPGETLHIPPLLTHRFCAESESVELIEVSTKQLDDVIRLEDDYGRGTINW